MKNIHEILKEYGLELPADKKAAFDKAWKENYRTKSEYDNAVSQRDNYKSSLDDVNAKLKEFEGVDVKDLQGQIAKLQGDLKAKDDEYAAKSWTSGRYWRYRRRQRLPDRDVYVKACKEHHL